MAEIHNLDCGCGGSTSIIFSETFRQLIVISGEQSDAQGSVEILDVEKTNYTCSQPQPYPLKVYEHCGGIVNGRVTVCGGIDSSGVIHDECFQLDPDTNEWKPIASMRSRKHFAAAVSTLYGKYSRASI